MGLQCWKVSGKVSGNTIQEKLRHRDIDQMGMMREVGSESESQIFGIYESPVKPRFRGENVSLHFHHYDFELEVEIESVIVNAWVFFLWYVINFRLI
jgi:hypothetical protein